MAKAIWRTAAGNGFLAGSFQFGFHGGHTGSVKQMVHDGDTVNVATGKNFPIRFLGIDTPEISFQAPGGGAFKPIDNQVFVDLLTWPFSDEFGHASGFSAALRNNIETRANANAATNHAALASRAEDALETLIKQDMTEAGIDENSFRFFLAFAYEALDTYGRLLAYVHPDQANVPHDERKPSYNERMLAAGFASPYFIFPNIDPFHAKGSPVEAAFDAHSPQTLLFKAPKLHDARIAVKAARERGDGIFNQENPLIFEAFELRFLARRHPPNRWVIDLSRDERVLLHPQSYMTIPNPEDRLWVPAEFAPLFEQAGWTLAPSPSDFV